MFPAEAHLVHSSSQMALLLVSTLRYDLEPWRKAQIQNPYIGSSTKDAGSQAGPLISCAILTSHLTLNLSIGMSFLI